MLDGYVMKFEILHAARRFGFDIQRYVRCRDPYYRLKRCLDRQQVTTLLDVGANVGQFALYMRMADYTGQIVSFEPQMAAHSELSSVARGDPNWIIARRCALGDRSGMTEIQIAGNAGKSSSILNMTDRHIAGDPKSAFIGKEEVELITLDEYLDSMPSLVGQSIGLKIDTQGYEAAVLAGLVRWAGSVKVLLTEMSLTPLYEGSIEFSDLFGRIEERGYRCVSIEPGFSDPETSEMLQVDATFERFR
jgi:FkbM family methyltransferase